MSTNPRQKMSVYPIRKNSKFFVGVELESYYQRIYINCGLYSKIKGVEFIKGYDCTINETVGCERIEFQSLPLTERALKKQVTRLYNTYGIKCYEHGCGLHVHISNSISSEKKVATIFSYLHRLNKYDFTILSGRADRNMYCGSSVRHVNQKDGEISTYHTDTYEVRLFAGGNNANWVHRCIDVSLALFGFNYDRIKEVDEFLPAFKDYFYRRYKYQLNSIQPNWEI